MQSDILAELLKADLTSLAFALFPHYFTYPPAPLHYELAELLTSDKSVIIALPREYAKSTYAWVFFPAWNVLHAKYKYIVYIASSLEKAKTHFRNLKAELLSHPLLLHLMNVLRDTETEFEYQDLTSDSFVLIQVYGAGQNLRGIRYRERRPDIVIVDDVESLESSMSETQRQKLKEWFFADVMPLSAQARFFVIGTVLHQDSLLNSLINDPPAGFTVIKRAILEDGKPTWSAKFPLERVLQLKEDFRKQGLLHRFYTEYMNEPIAEETQIFKQSYFRYYDPKSLDVSSLNVFTTVDLAISQKQEADYTAVVTVGVSSSNEWYVLDVDYGRYTPDQQIEAIFRAVQKWRPLVVGIETVAYQKALMHYLVKEQTSRNFFFRVKELTAERKKELRISTLSARYASGTVYHPNSAPWLAELEGELLMFPRGKHDDVIDALAYMEQIAYPPVHSVGGQKVLQRWSL